jgi:integrase
LLPKPSKIAAVEHHPALPYRHINPFLESLTPLEATAARALEIVIHTCLRTNEVLGAKWDEIDFDAGLWTVPGERMKMKKTHRIPLTEPALRMLRKCHANAAHTAGGDYVFPSPNSTEGRPRPLSNMAMLKLLERLKRRDITPHGFRSTFRDWAAEQTNFPREVCEMVLAHSVANDTEKAYQRGDLFEKRRTLMNAWAKYCETKPQESATVTAIRKRKA